MAYFSRPIPMQSRDSFFHKEWEELKEEYGKLRGDMITAMESRKLPNDAWKMFEELSGYDQPIDVDSHPGMLKVFEKGSDYLPLLVYVSREKRPGFKHHCKAGALNALVRIRLSMCFYLDPLTQSEDRVSFVQFPQRSGGIDEDDPNHSKMTNVFDVIMKGLDGLQGPVYCGTGCVQRRRVLYGSRPGSIQHKELHNRDKCGISEYEALKDKFGHSTVFIASVIEGSSGSTSASKEDILELVGSSYEGGTEWGTELGWLYGSCTEDILTGLKQHSRGWRSIYYSPDRPPFVGTAPKTGPDIFQQRKRWHKGLLEILVSRNCPLFCGYGGLIFLQRVTYIHYSFYPLYSVPLILYGILPAFSLITAKPFIPNVLDTEIVPFILLFIAISVSSFAEGLWVRIGSAQWWSTVRMWMSTTVTSSIAAVLEIFPAVVGIEDSAFYITPKPTDGKALAGAAEGFRFDSSAIFVIPTAFTLFNVVGLIVGVVTSIFSRSNLMVGEMLCEGWILANMWPFLRGLFARQSVGGLPVRTITMAACCASVLCCVAIISTT